MKIDLDFIQKHILFLHGLSGAGKGEVVKALQSEMSSRNFDGKKGEIVHISTGDLFRELKLKDPEIAKRMDSGNFIPTLEAVKGILTKKFREIAIRWSKGEEVLVVFDGAIRRGEYEEKDKETGESRKIPSQFDQIGECLFAGLKTARVSSNFRSKCHFALKAYLKTFDKPEEFFVDSTLKKAGHLLVDVTRDDAEALMLYRSWNNFGKLEEWIEKKVSDHSIGDEKRSFLQSAGDMVALARIIQSGDVMRNASSKHGFLIGYDYKVDFSIEDVLLMDDERKELMNEALCSYMEYFNKQFDLNGVKFTDSLSQFFKKHIKENIPYVRVDDETLESRKKRIDEFFIKTVPEVLKDGLGYNELSENRITPPGGNRIMLVNGPSRGVSYEELSQNLAPQVAQIFINRMNPQVEGKIIGEQYLHVNKERVV